MFKRYRQELKTAASVGCGSDAVMVVRRAQRGGVNRVRTNLRLEWPNKNVPDARGTWEV